MTHTGVRATVRSVHRGALTHDVALLALQLALGAVFVGHGAQKAFGAFGGSGLEGAEDTVGQLGLAPESFWGTLLGLLTLPAGLVPAASMTVATLFVHLENGFFSESGGIELTMVLAVASPAVALLGPGRLSVDRRRAARPGLAPTQLRTGRQRPPQRPVGLDRAHRRRRAGSPLATDPPQPPQR